MRARVRAKARALPPYFASFLTHTLLYTRSFRIVENSEKEYNKMCIDQNHDAEDALEFITSLRHLKGAPSARPVSLRVQHALKMSGHAVKLQSQVSGL